PITQNVETSFEELEIRRFPWWNEFVNWINHYKVYQSIIDNDYGSALILEDNIDIEVEISSIMSDVQKILPSDWEILYLGHCGNTEGTFDEPLMNDDYN